MKVVYLKYGLTALMMAFAMTLCFSCSSDDDEEEVPSDYPVLSLEYEIKLTSRNFSEQIIIRNSGGGVQKPQTHNVYVGDTLSLSVKPIASTAQPKSVDASETWGMISFDKETNKVFIVKKYSSGKATLTVKITDPSDESVSVKFFLQVHENN